MMWKMSNKKRKMAFLTALIGSLMAGSSVGAANLMATIPSDYANSQMGGVTGSRVTTKVDAAPVVGAVKNLNRDPATFSVMIDGESKIFLRQYVYGNTELKGSILMDADGDWASGANPTGVIKAVPNAHAVTGFGNTIYATGYDQGQVGIAHVEDDQIAEDTTKTVDLKQDIKEKTGDIDAKAYDTYTDTNGNIQTTTVHGEGLLVKDGYLYVAASVNLKGGYDNYDNGYLMQYKINSDGGLSYNGYARIGKNAEQVKLNNYNHLILNTSAGGYQNYGSVNEETSLDYVNITGNNIGNLHDKKSISLPEQVKNDGYDFRDMKVLPDGTVYVMKYTLSATGGGLTGRVYQTTMVNLMSKNPDDWQVVLDGKVDDGSFGRLNAEYYTKRLWVEWGNNLYVYEDGDTKPTHQWATKDFSTDKQFYQFNSVTMLPTDQVWGSLAKLTTYRPEGFTASSETKITLENADAKIGTVTRREGITGTSADRTAFSDVTSDDGTYSFTKDEVLSINLGKEGDHATNAAAVIQAKDGKDITIDASGHTLQLASKNYIASPVGIYAGNGKNVTITADKVDVVTSGYSSGNSLTNAIWNDGGKNTASQITVNGDVNISMSGGYGGNGVAIQKSFRWGENSQESTVSSAITIHGNLKIAGEDSATWGIPVNQENVLSRFNNAGILTNIEKSKVTVTGDVDMSVYGNGITTNAVGSEVSIGGGHITVPQGTKYGYYTLGAYAGTINVNMNEVGSAAGTHDVQLDGDVFALKSTGTINLGLATKNSYLNGIIDNGGKVNMWLQNGAVWTNEAKNTRYKQDDEDVGNNEVSRVTFLHGGTKSGTGDTAGVIIQTANSKSLTIDKFSGAAKVLYSHDSNTPTKILGGDVNIGSAIRGSEIVLRTDYDDNMQSDAVKNQVLNALAEKLYYKDAVNGQTALSGKVEIAEGLTASSVAKYTGNIAFNQTNGQGSLGSGETPEPPAEQSKTLFTSSITGGDDKEYKDDHVWQDQVYTFTKDKTTVQVEGGAAVDAVKDVTITADGNELDLTGGEAGIRAAAGKTVDITAGTLKVNGKTGIDAAGTVTLKGKSEITGAEKAVNVQKGGSVTLGTSTISGDVENSGHLTLDAATTVSGSIANAGVLAVNGETHAKDLTTTGTMTVGTDGVLAAENINVNGGTFTANGSVSSTVKADKGGKAILKGKKTALKGLVSGDHSSIEATLSGKDSALNGSLEGAGSVTLSLADQANWTGNAVGNGAYAVTIGKDSTWTGSSAGNNTSLTLGGTWNNRGTSSLKQMAGNGGVIDMTDAKAGTVTIQNYGGSSTYIYKHDTTKPADANSGYAILGGDVKISHADKGSEITLLTDHVGLDFASTKADEKNLISGTLNALAGKLYYTGYADGNLSGTVKIAEGLTASSKSLRSKTITFSTADTGTKKAGQGFYAYTPEQEKPNYKTGAITKSEDISLSRELDESGVAHVTVTESNAGGGKFASALYAGESTDPSSPMTVKMSGKGLALNAAQSDGQAAAIYAGANTYIKVMNPSADQKLAITATNTDIRASHGIYALGNAHLNISGPVGITDIVTKGDAATGINIQGQRSEITIDGPLTIRNVKGLKERGAGMNAAGILVTGSSSTVTVSGAVDISGVRGSGIKLAGEDAKVSVGGGTITAAEDSDHSHNFYAVRVDKGTLDINMKDGAAGDTTTKITGDMYATGQYGKKVVEYTGGELIDWNAAGILNVALTDKDSFWKGDVSNANGSSAGIVNLYLGSGASWTGNNLSGNTVNANLDQATWTGSSSGNAMHLKLDHSIWNVNGASKLASFSGDKGSIFVASDAGDISVGDYSGNTTVIYNHDTDHPTNILGGSFTIGQAKDGSAITLITDNQGITKGFTAQDKAEDQNTVNEVLNKLAQKLFYTANDGKLAGTVKIADGLTASSKALKTGDISFSTDATGTKTPGQGFYEYTVKDDSVITDPITGNLDKKYVNLGIETEKGIYNFTQNAVIDVTKGDYSSNLGAIESSNGPITINADGKNLDVSYHVLKGSNVARAVATGLSYGKSKDVTITAKSLKLSTDTTGFRAQGVYATGGQITIDADTTISTSAQTESNGIYSGNGGTVTMNGNLTIQKDSKAANYIALKSDDNGVINVNMKDGKEGASIVKIDGDVYTKSAETYDYWEDETTSTSSTVNLALQGKDSSWNGRSLYEVTSSGDDSTSYGTFNLWLTDGATWTNEKNGKEVPSGFAGSHVTKLTGGSDAAHAGNIFQNDTKKITIDNYSGNTNIYYAHTGNGEAASDYAAGDTIIKHAEKDSVVSLITDNSGVNMSSADSIVNVLNSLAGKLTYSNFTKDENNLTGYVKIADGLTSSSAAMYTGDMVFSKKDGKGSLKDEDSIRPDLPAPDHQIKNEFTTTLTGVKSKDKEYYKAGVIKSDGLYQFTQNSSITTTNAHGADMNQATTIDAKGKTLTFNTDLTYGTTVHAIGANSTDGVTINAGKLVLNAHSTNGRIEGINVGQGALTINGNTEMNIKGVGYTLGLYAAGDSALTFNGNVTAMGDETSEWGLTAKNGAWGYYRCSLVYSDSNYGLQKGPKVTINGDVNAKIDGNCLFAKGGHAKLTINGGGNIEINKDNEHTYYAMIAECGTTSMNVNLDENYDAVSARDNKLVLKGNIGASTGAISAHETELYTKVNLGLATADSVWTGVAHNRFNDDGNSAYSSDKKFYGAINVFLQNGATWNNEKWGATYKPWGSSGFAGSHVAKFVGGSDVAHAGNIFQNDQNTLTIDNYSGNTNIYYAHTGNGEAASDYVAGDTIIRSAAEGSAVSLITDNSGIAMDNEYSVANVLNALAGKLTYSSFVTGEKNLTGYVKIADGLTASSAAKQTGNIAFNADTGKGSLENGSMKPGFTYPETQKPEATEKNQGITGDAKTDYQYKKDGILKEDGSYVFTQNPTKIEVESGAAVDATDKDINIDTTKAKLELKGETGIHANGADVTVNGNTGISGKVGIDAANGNVTLNGSTDIVGTDAAINAGEGGNVDINTNNSALNIKGDINANGGSIIVDSSKATGVIDGDVSASNGGSVEISLNDAKSSLTGSYRVDDSSSIVMNIANGATWNLTDDEDDAEGMSLFRMAKAPAATADKGLTINGGESKAKTGYLNMTKRTKNLNIASYSGWETIIYGHENAGDKDEDYKSGNTIINKAAKDSGVILSTDNSGINMGDKVAVEATLKALAHKLTYTDHEENGSNLTGKVQIADGLTASSASKYLGNMRWDENGKGQYVDGSIQWEPTIEEGEYETFFMKGARSAVTTSFHSWRDNMQDTYTGADLADEDGIFAKALGGKTSSDVSGLKDSNSYWGAQIGYDKALANGWHTGVAFDYRDGDSDYLLGGKGDNKLYSFGVYGVKKMENGSYFRVAAKAGRVENEYDVYTELRNKLHADYKANAYGLTAEYGKTFGSEMSYITPKVQLTWSRVGSKDYTGSANNGAIMNIYQDSYDSLVGRLGFEAGMKKAHGSLHAGLYLAHEFSGDIDTRYFAKDGGWKSTSFDGDDTWAELVLGGEYRLGGNSQLYADFARDLGGDFQRKWKLNAGIRLRF